MPQTNAVMGTGVALAGLGGLAGGALIANHHETPTAKPAAAAVTQPVETQTVVVRTVEHRTIRLKPKHHHLRAAQAAPTRAAAPAVAAAPTPAPVVQAAPVVQRTAAVAPVSTIRTQPVHTHTSGAHTGGGSGSGGGDGSEGRDD